MRLASVDNNGLLPAKPETNAPYGNEPADTAHYLDDPSQLSILPDGEYDALHRPLATSQSIPGRGNTSHGVDQDIETDEYSPVNLEQSNHTQTVQQYNTVEAVVPIPVHVVHDPLRSVRRTTQIITPFGYYETYGGAVGDLVSVRRVLPYNDARTKVTVIGQFPGYTMPNTAAVCVYWVGTDPENMDSGVVIAPQNANGPLVSFEMNGKNPIYAGLIPRVLYDGRGNNMRLSLVVEVEGILFADNDHSPHVQQ